MADRRSDMHYVNDPWSISSLISAFLELLLSILLLLSVIVAFLTSQLVRILGLDPPCTYIGYCRHAFHSAENSVPPGANNVSGNKTSMGSACKDDCCVFADDQHEIIEEDENEQSMVADHQYHSGQCSVEAIVHSVGKLATRNISDAMMYPKFDIDSLCGPLVFGDSEILKHSKIPLLSAEPQDEHVKGNTKCSPEASIDNLQHYSCNFPLVFSDLDNGRGNGLSGSIDGIKDRSSPATSVGNADRESFLLTGNQQERQGTYVDMDEENDINALKEALQAERSISVALEAELEKERTAAAIAASEAMAMISRLQEEKAAMQIDVSQLQRVSEEKADYDQQAISLLEEILFKREKEKFVLEREVELYRVRLRAEKVEKRRPSRLAKVVMAKQTELPLALTGYEDAAVAQETNQQNAAIGAGILEEDQVEDLEQKASKRPEGIFGSASLGFPIKHDNGQMESSHEWPAELEKHPFSIDEEETHLILDRLSAIEDELHELHGSERDKEGAMGSATENEFLQNNFEFSPKALFDGSRKIQLNRRLFFPDETCQDKDWIVEHALNVDDSWEQHEWNSQSSEEVHHLSVRMDALEADRGLLKQALDSIKLKNSEISLLEEIVQHLRCLRALRREQNDFGDFSPGATFSIKQVSPAFKKRRYSDADQHEGGP